jgi:DNA invertase Pin-like site-specific DNA recombinase
MIGQRIGYLRVSTLDQNPDRQLETVLVDRTFTDHASGKDVARPQLDALLRFAREGDTVVVHSMDRLARNLDDLRRIVRSLTDRGIRIAFVKEQLTFTGEDSPMATLLLSVMGAFAEFERALIRERQREGITLAKQRGCLSGQEEGVVCCPTGGTAAAGRCRRGEGSGGTGVWNQPGDPLPVPAHR